jgi:hypothetical protein
MKKIFTLLFIIYSAAAGFASQYPFLNYDSAKVLTECTEKLSMGFGYDTDMEIYGIFSYNVEKVMTPSKTNPQTELKRCLDGVPVETVKDIYLSLSANTTATEYLVKYYQKRKAWKYINYLNNKVIPGNKVFMTLLSEYVKTSPRCAGFAMDVQSIYDSKIKAILSQKNRITIVDDYQ